MGVAVLVVGPLAGVLVDRWDARRTALGTEVVRGVLAGLLTVVVFVPVSDLPIETLIRTTPQGQSAVPRLVLEHKAIARLRRIMEDPQQLLSNCVADYVVDQLRANGNRPQDVVIPGFSQVDF
jgi:hypothetical protein